MNEWGQIMHPNCFADQNHSSWTNTKHQTFKTRLQWFSTYMVCCFVGHSVGLMTKLESKQKKEAFMRNTFILHGQHKGFMQRISQTTAGSFVRSTSSPSKVEVRRAKVSPNGVQTQMSDTFPQTDYFRFFFCACGTTGNLLGLTLKEILKTKTSKCQTRQTWRLRHVPGSKCEAASCRCHRIVVL